MEGFFQASGVHWRLLLVYPLTMRPSKQQKLDILATMHLIRKVEQGIADRYTEGKMRCPTHLSIGQECPPSVLGSLLTIQDLAVSTHRAHAHYLGKGGDVKRMLAEIYGKSTGCSKGRGGSMHLIDESVGFKGSTAIVGNTIPIGVGLGLSKKIKSESGIAVVFLGDGAVEEGAFYESANFAATQKLPVLFVCENNLYSVYSPLSVRQPQGRNIHHMAAAIGLNAFDCDGNQVEDSFVTLAKAIESVRAGEGASFVELRTYRWLEHCGPNYDNHIGYRSVEEFEQWKSLEPIARFERQLLDEGVITQERIAKINNDADELVAQAFEFAHNSPMANASTDEPHVFAIRGTS